ncbi:MAG: DUF4105 domain-containing protein [Methylococcales bacterium]
MKIGDLIFRFFLCYIGDKLLLFIVLFFLAAHNAFANKKEAYIEQLITKARVQQIWSQREWRVLMHYSTEFFGTNSTSLVDDSEFFLDKQGQTLPQAELETTLRLLFTPSNDDDNKAVICRFPARSAWLKRALNINTQYLPQNQCVHLNNWLKKLAADRLTLIFPVSVLNSPASMFGHTFLRFDRKTEKKPDLLAWTVSYAARSETETGFSFALKGLFGGYPGKFNLAPYYIQVKEYSDIENRDMWEYQLDFSQAEIHTLLLHLWELLPVYSDYYFVDENCSYQLLTLLEAARPELKLTEQFDWDAAPTETVRAIVQVPGLLKNVDHRPSNRHFILSRAERLMPASRRLAREVALEEIELETEWLKDVDNSTWAQVLELAYDYATYQDAISKRKQLYFDAGGIQNQRGQQQLLHKLLTARSELAIESQQPKITKPKYRPDQGHHGHRIAIRYGYEASRQFLQMDFRWAYHDLYDPSSGFTNGMQLEFFKPALRYYPQKNRLQLESIDFVNIISIPTRDYFIRPFSWEVSAAVRRHRLDENNRPLMGDFQAGLGVTYALTKNSQVSLFANVAMMIGDDFNQFTALAGGSKILVLSTLTDFWRAGLYAQAMQYFQGITQTSYRYGSRQRFSLGRDNAIVVDVAKTQEFGDSFFSAQFSWQFYF